MSTHRLRSRSGMTLIEVMVSLVIGVLVLQVALGLLGQQGRAFSRGTTAMHAVQNGRYAVNALEKDVRTLGTGVVPRQPSLVYAGPDVLAFNADYATADPNDFEAVYRDPDTPAGQLEAVPAEGRFTVPMTLFGYPDSSYYRGDSNSPAETLVFFFQPDATTARTDDYALYRQVNGTAPAVIARNLLPTGGASFFEYLTVRVPEDGPTQMLSVGGGPLSHAAPLHGSPQDTGRLARVDSVRAVKVRFTVTNGLTGVQEQRRSMERTIRLPNAGLATRNVCGDAPRPVALGAERVVLAGGAPGVRLAWAPSADETGGEGDVLRYILWKRVLPDDFKDPWLSIPAGLAGYAYVDEFVMPETEVQYALAVQDCTPSRSAQSVSAAIALP